MVFYFSDYITIEIHGTGRYIYNYIYLHLNHSTNPSIPWESVVNLDPEATLDAIGNPVSAVTTGKAAMGGDGAVAWEVDGLRWVELIGLPVYL